MELTGIPLAPGWSMLSSVALRLLSAALVMCRTREFLTARAERALPVAGDVLCAAAAGCAAENMKSHGFAMTFHACRPSSWAEFISSSSRRHTVISCRLLNFHLVQFASAFQLFVEHEGIDRRNQRRDHDGRHRAARTARAELRRSGPACPGKESFSSEAMCGVPDLFVGDGPGSANADEEISPHFAHDVAQQRNQQAHASFDGTAYVEHQPSPKAESGSEQ